MQHKNKFFIVGAAKAGTTSLANYLGQHPNIYMPDCYREPAYFASDTGVKTLFDYQSLFRDVNQEHLAVGEKSTAYLFDNEAPSRIRAFCRAAKIIVVLRDQVDMAYSLYCHNRREGLERIRSFHDALAIEQRRMESINFRCSVVGYHKNFYYRARATYAPQIERYFKNFPSENIKLIKFTDLKGEPELVVRSLYEWLGVDSSFVPEIRIENEGGRMRLQGLYNLCIQSKVASGLVKAVTSRQTRRKIYWLMRRRGGYRALETSERSEVESLFEADRFQLAVRYGVNLGKN